MQRKGSTKFEKLHHTIMPRISGSYPNAGMVKSGSDAGAIQSAFLAKQFATTVNREYYNRVAIEADRRYALMEFAQMEWYPTIMSAINLIAREMCIHNEHANVLNIYSDRRQIKDELEHLFHNILNVNVNLYSWSRETVKNGDCFLLLHLDEGNGVRGVKALNKYAERAERMNQDSGEWEIAFKDSINNQTYMDMQIAHFRLLGDMDRMPYGQSHLEKIRKTFKMLTVAEDAMMIKRLTRSTNRLVYKVDVGNLDDNDVESYMEAIASRFKREANVDPNTGQADYRMGLADVTQDYFIPVRNGQSNTSIDVVSATDNPDQIADIEYLRDNLLTGLEVPKPFINFQESSGEGKSLAMLDVRFARLVRQYQQYMVAELNKIAMIHLYLRGYDEDYDSFRLSMNVPSMQEDILRNEHLTNRLTSYSNAIAPDEATQIAPMSHLKAKREILEMSDDEIMEDLRQQMFERAIGEEFRKRFSEIDASGIFDDLIKKFRKSEEDIAKSKEADAEGDAEGGGPPPPPGGGNPFEAKARIMKMNKDMKLLKEGLEKERKKRGF